MPIRRVYYQDEACFERVVAVLPQLCRLGLKLSCREAQGARPSASMWEVLLRCADCCPVEDNDRCTKGMRSSPVQVSYVWMDLCICMK